MNNMHNMNKLIRQAASMALWIGGMGWVAAAGGGEVSFVKHKLDSAFRAEGVCVGDFNGDGLLDVGAGNVYYAAPDWTMTPMLAEPKQFDINGYSDAFICFADDVNRDGMTDMIVVGMPAEATRWLENPGPAGGVWKEHVAVPVTNNEGPLFGDVWGDGRRQLVYGAAPEGVQGNSPDRRLAYAYPGQDPAGLWTVRLVSDKGGAGSERFAHGLGLGDINGDARNDIVVLQGWYEAPADRARTPWKFHAAELGDRCAQMIVFDYDGDGDSDVLSTSAHDRGVWWHEQMGDGWKRHTIDESYTQTHAVCQADIDRDGLPDFVTGKRFWAHNGKDPGANEPAVLNWYRFTRQQGEPSWTRCPIDDDSGVGTQFEVTDINRDGKLDVATANKKGVHVFLQQ